MKCGSCGFVHESAEDCPGGPTTVFEQLAEAFYRETGFMARGKDRPPGWTQDEDEAARAWEHFLLWRSRGWRVPISEKRTFGKRTFRQSVRHGLTGRVLVLHRGLHGWKTPDGGCQFVKLPQQTYYDDLVPFAVPDNREIVVVDLDAGKWVTVWATKDSEITYPQQDPNPTA